MMQVLLGKKRTEIWKNVILALVLSYSKERAAEQIVSGHTQKHREQIQGGKAGRLGT